MPQPFPFLDRASEAVFCEGFEAFGCADARHTGDRADTKLMLPTELLEQIHFGFPVHKRPPDLVGVTVG